MQLFKPLLFLSIGALALALAAGCSTGTGADRGERVGGFESTSPKADDPNAVHHYDLFHDGPGQAVTISGYNSRDELRLEVRVALASESTPEDEVHHLLAEQLHPEYAYALFDTEGNVLEGELPEQASDLLEQMRRDFEEQQEASGKSDSALAPVCFMNCGIAVVWAVTQNYFGLALNGGLCAGFLASGACF